MATNSGVVLTILCSVRNICAHACAARASLRCEVIISLRNVGTEKLLIICSPIGRFITFLDFFCFIDSS